MGKFFLNGIKSIACLLLVFANDSKVISVK
jgi:hypothetical protein